VKLILPAQPILPLRDPAYPVPCLANKNALGLCMLFHPAIVCDKNLFIADGFCEQGGLYHLV